MKKIVCVIALLLVVLTSGCSKSENSKNSKPWRESLALTENLQNQRCVVATSEELAQLELAVKALEFDDPQRAFGWMKMGAAQTLGHGIYRRVDKEPYPVCAEKKLYERVGIALARQGGLGRHRIAEYELKLASNITNPPEALVDDVARVAFSEAPWQSEVFVDEDIRPLARAVLASYRDRANKFGSTATLQMGSENALGTGAAQIAVATRQPAALQKTLQLMEDLTNRFPEHKVIPWHARNRLYELAWALTYSDEKSSERIAAIEKIMVRKVQSNATIFGMIELPPKKMCFVLKKISPNQDFSKYPYCLSDAPYEQ